jgi:hypothetical protein
MDDEDPLDLLARWLTDQRATIDIPGHVTVRETTGAYGRRTTVVIDHLVPCPLEAHDGWRISTKPTFLPREHFSSQARHFLKTAEPGRGRAIYCHDRSAGEVVAGLSYHVDDTPGFPVLITTIAFRTDIASNAYLRLRTLAGAFILKQYVHAVSATIGRGGHVDLDLAARNVESYARELGFRKAPKVKGLRPGGLHLRQEALPGQASGSGA